MDTPWLARVIGVLIVGAALLAAFLLWLIVGERVVVNTPLPIEEAFVGGIGFLYERYRPGPQVFWASVSLGVMAFAVAAGVERWAVRRVRFELGPAQAPLSPPLVMERTAGRFAGEVTVTVLIPL